MAGPLKKYFFVAASLRHEKENVNKIISEKIFGWCDRERVWSDSRRK